MRIRIAGSLKTMDYLSYVFSSKASLLYAKSASRACTYLISTGVHDWVGKSIVWSTSASESSRMNVRAMCDIVKLIEKDSKVLNNEYLSSIGLMTDKIGEEESLAFHKKALSIKWFEVLFSYYIAKEANSLVADENFEFPLYYPFANGRSQYRSSLIGLRKKCMMILNMLVILVRHMLCVGAQSAQHLSNTVIVESSHAMNLKGDSKHSHLNILKSVYPELITSVFSSDKNDSECIYVNPYSISFKSFSYLAFLLAYVLRNIKTRQFFVLQSYWLSYSKHITLFEKFKPSILVYLTFPNGMGSFRSDDAVVTGLARRFNLECHGIQTRSIYINKYEDCFDLFDKYFAWKDYWNNTRDSRFMKVKNIEFIDCIYTGKYPSHNTEENTILIFDGDINNSSHYNEKYYSEFINAIGYCASNMKNIKFLYKLKNQEILTSNESLIYLFENCKNVKRLSNGRFDYEEAMAKSNAVVSIGFTTPGYEAVLAQKESIYYSSWPKEYLNFSGKINIASTRKELFKAIEGLMLTGSFKAKNDM